MNILPHLPALHGSFSQSCKVWTPRDTWIPIWCCPGQDTVRAVSDNVGEEALGLHWLQSTAVSPMGCLLMLLSLHELTPVRCFQSRLHSGSFVPSGAEMGFPTSNCCCIFFLSVVPFLLCNHTWVYIVLANAVQNLSWNRNKLLIYLRTILWIHHKSSHSFTVIFCFSFPFLYSLATSSR